MIRPAIRRRAETSMATDAVAVPFTVGPGIRLPGTLRGASETLSTTPSDREGMAGHSQSRVNDAELIREAQRGNHAAFEQLVRQYDGPVLRLAYHMTRSEQDAQDIYQEAFLKAYRNIGNFRFECSFYTWIYRIVTNLCLDLLRTRQVRKEDSGVVSDGEGEEFNLLDNVSDNRAAH